MQRYVSERCDFFVNFSISDASPTTLFETMSMGLIPVSTPQCGYYYPCIIPLQIGDAAGNLAALFSLQNIDESKMSAMQSDSIRMIETNHTWSGFCETMWNAISSSFGSISPAEFSAQQLTQLQHFVQKFTALFNEGKINEAISLYENQRPLFPSSPKLDSLDSIVAKLRKMKELPLH